MTVVTTFGCEKFDTEIQLFLTRLQCQKQLKMKNLIKNNYSKVCTQRKLYLKTKPSFEKKQICQD